MALLHIASRDNPKYKALARQLADNAGYRTSAQVWLQGDHLCRAALARACVPHQWVVRETFFSQAARRSDWLPLLQAVQRGAWVLTDELMTRLCSQEPQAQVACLLALPAAAPMHATCNSLVLDRVQDTGNVGSMLRSAAAMGYQQVIALGGTAALWQPKVLRAAMGAHFGLQLHEGVTTEALLKLAVPRLVTRLDQGTWLHQLRPPKPHAWVMGNEGQGVCAELLAAEHTAVRIAQPGGEESLNVAAAAAICMYQGSLS
jgi:RNA methyltransferase, TrmH family